MMERWNSAAEGHDWKWGAKYSKRREMKILISRPFAHFAGEYSPWAKSALLRVAFLPVVLESLAETNFTGDRDLIGRDTALEEVCELLNVLQIHE